MRAAVWRLDRDARVFKCRCETCGPITQETPGAQRDDEDRWYIPGYLISSTMQGPATEDRWYECPTPVLNAPWVARLFRWWRVTAGDISGVTALLRPSAAMLDLWDALAAEMAEMKAMMRKREIDALRNGAH